MIFTALTDAANAVSSISWPQLGAGGLLTVAIGMILTGGLVPRRSADKWEAAWREERAASIEKDKQLAELTEIGHTTVALLQSITANSEKSNSGGGGS